MRKPPRTSSQLIEDAGPRRPTPGARSSIPIDQVLTFAAGGADKERIDNPYAADFIRNWVDGKYRVELPLEHIRATPLRAAAR